MNYFIPLKIQINKLLPQIVEIPVLHAKWLNTLSYLENCGARKIAACEHPTQVKEEMLKHAAEEFRHAHYLKKQIIKINCSPLPNYTPCSLLGGIHTMHYLNRLDIQTSRLLAQLSKSLSYFLVTYAIELRAQELYPIYNEFLKKHCPHIRVTSILLEEKEHLQEMTENLKCLDPSAHFVKKVCYLESSLCEKLLWNIEQELLSYEGSLQITCHR